MNTADPFEVAFYPIDLGSGVRARWTQSRDLIMFHRTDAGDACGTFIALSTRKAAHEIVERDPLHIAPQIVCPTCGHAGIIEGGQWVPL